MAIAAARGLSRQSAAVIPFAAGDDPQRVFDRPTFTLLSLAKSN